jgi:tRNA pseudouridine13 synthase
MNANKKVKFEEGHLNTNVISSPKEAEITNQEKYAFLQETDVGIEFYVHSENEGFMGSLKERYSDFQVWEIDLEGNVAQITSRNPLEISKSLNNSNDSQGKKENGKISGLNTLKELINEENLEKLIKYTAEDNTERSSELLIPVG